MYDCVCEIEIIGTIVLETRNSGCSLVWRLAARECVARRKPRTLEIWAELSMAPGGEGLDRQAMGCAIGPGPDSVGPAPGGQDGLARRCLM